jgi:hypothetical protein
MTLNSPEPPPTPGDDSATEPTEREDRVAPLRGAGVQIDTRRLSRIVIGLVLATLAVLAVVFTVIGVNRNNQFNELHHQGVPVTVTVTYCLGLLGGSGSNAAGYSCHGSYTLRGHTYTEQIPGDAFYRPGAQVAAVAVPNDPALVSPVIVVATEHASSSAFIVPAVCFILFVIGVVAILLRRRSTKEQ